MAIETQEQFEKLRSALKEGQYADRPELQAELIAAAKAWKSKGATPPASSAVSPPQGGSIADSLGQGLSFGFSDELAGAGGALVNSALGVFGKGTGESFGDAYTGIRDAARSNQAAFSERNPGTALAAEIAGGVLTGGVGAARTGAFQVAKSAPTLAARLAPVAATGAVQGGLYGLGTSEADSVGGAAMDTMQGAALGGVTAPILPALAGGARKLSTSALHVTDSPIYKSSVKLLEDKVGIRLTSGQKTGSSSLKSTETTIADTIMGGSISKALDRNRHKLQSHLFKLAGFADEDVATGLLTRESLDRAADNFSKKYARLFAGTRVNLKDQDFIDSIGQIAAEHSKYIPPLQKRQISSIIEEFLGDTNSTMSGRTYQKIRSALGKKGAGNTEHAGLYRDLKRTLDDAFFASGGSRMGRKLTDLQYGRFKQLESVFRTSGAQQTSQGLIPLAMITSRAAKQPDRKWEQIVRAGQMVLGDPVANSGTPTRLLNSAAYLGGGVAAGGMDGGLLTVGAPFGAAQMLSRGHTGSNVVDRLIQAGLLTTPVTAPIGQRVTE